MRLKDRKVGQICVLEFSGKIVIGEGTVLLERRFKELLDDGERVFLFNMLEVPWLDSAGIGSVVACHKRARDREAILKLVLRGKAHDLFTFYELGKVFKLFEGLETALASYSDSQRG